MAARTRTYRRSNYSTRSSDEMLFGVKKGQFGKRTKAPHGTKSKRFVYTQQGKRINLKLW